MLTAILLASMVLVERKSRKMKLALCTEIRKDGMQKWERYDLPKSDHMRYIWLAAFQSKPDVKVGSQANLEFVTGTGGTILAIGGIGRERGNEAFSQSLRWSGWPQM